MRIDAHDRGGVPPAHGLCGSGRVTDGEKRTCKPHAPAVQWQRMSDGGAERNDAGRAKDGVGVGVRQRRAGVIRDEERNVPPLRGGDGELELEASKASCGVARIGRIERQVDWLVTEHDGKGVGFGAAGNEDGGVAGGEIAKLLRRRTVDDFDPGVS